MSPPPSIESFHNLHAGETCLLIGNGPSLASTDRDFLARWPSFGVNLIHLALPGFLPTYYVAVDSSVMRRWSDEINQALRGVPKFLPTPNLDGWQGDNIYRWYHRPGPLWPFVGSGALWPRSILSEQGITYVGVLHAAAQIAYFMGFTTMLCVGLDNTGSGHPYPEPEGTHPFSPELHEAAWAVLRDGFEENGVKLLNASAYTELRTLPRVDWRTYEPEAQEAQEVPADR